MKHTHILSFLILSLTFAAASCEREPVDTLYYASEKVSFATDGAAFALTRVSTGTAETESLSSFFVTATSGTPGAEEEAAWTNAAFEGNGVYEGAKRWPKTDPGWSFYASSEEMAFNSNGTYIASASNTRDVICAYLPRQSVEYKAKNTLTFEHIFARIGTVTVQQEAGFTVTGISVTVVPKVSGRYNIRLGAGRGDATGWSNTVNGSAVTIASTAGNNANDLWLVPGTYTVTASWTATQAGGVSKTYTGKTMDIGLTGGYINTLTLTLGGEAAFGVELLPFEPDDRTVSFGFGISSTYGAFGHGRQTRQVELTGSSSAWTVEYSTDGGDTWITESPTGLGVTRLSSKDGKQTYAVTLAEAEVESTDTYYDGNWPSGARYNTMRGSADHPVDLSREDVFGTPTVMNTANTYVIHTPGTYAIPLVYGNAVTDGRENPRAYSQGPNTWYSLSHYFNAYETPISSPWIEDDLTANGHTPASAALVWQDVTGMVSVNPTLRTYGGKKYLVFTADPSSINYGSAVVSVRDEQGTTVWSWLVWAYGDELNDETIEPMASSGFRGATFLSKPIGYKPVSETYNVYAPFDCIVRFTSGSGESLFYTVERKRQKAISNTDNEHTYNPYTTSNLSGLAVYYQYGRNVPHPAGSDTPGVNVNTDRVAVPLSSAIRHPESYYMEPTDWPYYWCSEGDSRAWNLWNIDIEYLNPDVYFPNPRKSLFDPSPAGYILPQKDDFLFTTTDGNKHDVGSWPNVSEAAYFNVTDHNGDGTIDYKDWVGGWFYKRYEGDTEGFLIKNTGFIAPYNSDYSNYQYQVPNCVYLATSTHVPRNQSSTAIRYYSLSTSHNIYIYPSCPNRMRNDGLAVLPKKMNPAPPHGN